MMPRAHTEQCKQNVRVHKRSTSEQIRDLHNVAATHCVQSCSEEPGCPLGRSAELETFHSPTHSGMVRQSLPNLPICSVDHIV